MSTAKSKLCLAVLLLCSVCAVKSNVHCQEAQKAFYMSYGAQSKRDTMPVLFTEINKKMSVYNYTYNDGKGAEITLKNLHPQFYYNEHHQKQVPIDEWHVNVTLGDVNFAFRFDYQITNGTSKRNGWARAHVLADQTSYYVKQLLIINGYLEWEPTSIAPLTVTYLLIIQHSQPMLTYEEQAAIEQMLNDHAGDRKLKSQMMNEFNTNYKTMLKEHLNSEQLIGGEYIDYTYKNITLKFINTIKEYKLSLNQVKGLEAFFHWEVENQTFNCTPAKFEFNYNQTKFGGIQQWYSLSSMKQAFIYALTQGLFNVKIDKVWEVPQFQFFMGDLSNAVPYAGRFPADDPFDVTCKWNGNRSQVKLNAYTGNNNIYVSAQVVCMLEHKSKQLLQAKFSANFEVNIMPQENYLNFIVANANIFMPVFKSIDPNFVIQDQSYGRFAIAAVMQGLRKAKVFGSGWKTSARKYPSCQVIMDYMVVFDPSEM